MFWELIFALLCHNKTILALYGKFFANWNRIKAHLILHVKIWKVWGFCAFNAEIWSYETALAGRWENEGILVAAISCHQSSTTTIHTDSLKAFTWTSTQASSKNTLFISRLGQTSFVVIYLGARPNLGFASFASSAASLTIWQYRAKPPVPGYKCDGA